MTLSRQIASIDRQGTACQVTSFVRCQPQYGCTDCLGGQQVPIGKEIELIHIVQRFARELIVFSGIRFKITKQVGDR